MCFMFKWNQKNSNVFIALLSALKVEHTVEFSNSYYNQHPHKDNLFWIIPDDYLNMESKILQ